MNSRLWQNVLGAMGIALAAPVMALSVNFEGLAPGFFFPGESVVQGIATLTTQNGIGVIDTAAAFGPGTGLDLAVPLGTQGQFYSGLNDGALTLTLVDGKPFQIRGFDFGFISPLSNLYNPGEVPGALVMSFDALDGTGGSMTWSFGGADSGGRFSMNQVGVSPLYSTVFTRVSFFACTFDANLSCVAPNNNFNQFAIDNIIPEPGSLALAALALGLVGGLRKRRSQQAG